MVVHGDDFTALATAENLSWYETKLAETFELKIKGRLGEGAHCDREVRVLNRSLRVDGEGLHHEADPRHAELLIKALNCDSDANGVVTPGVREKDVDVEAFLDGAIPDNADYNFDAHDDADEIIEPISMIASLKLQKLEAKKRLRVTFNEKIDTLVVTPYAECYLSIQNA